MPLCPPTLLQHFSFAIWDHLFDCAIVFLSAQLSNQQRPTAGVGIFFTCQSACSICQATSMHSLPGSEKLMRAIECSVCVVLFYFYADFSELLRTFQ